MRRLPQDCARPRLARSFRVNDLAAHRIRVATRGGEPGELQERAWMNIFTVRDPDGNEIVFGSTNPNQQTIDPW
jgi:hypothetical protein